MFFPSTPNIFIPGDGVFMLLKFIRSNITIEKKNFLAYLFISNLCKPRLLIFSMY